MANVEIVLDSAGIQELLKSSEMASVCEAEASRMTRATGMKYVPDVRVGKTRVVAAGHRKLTDKDKKENVCPKCGEWHPNCNCKTEK